MATHKEETLLTLRECARGFPASLARKLEIPRATARKRIQSLEKEGIITDYTPVVIPKTFGSPYLVRIEVNPEDYKVRDDLEATIDSLKKFLNSGIGHAPLCFYVYRDSENDVWKVHCLTMTFQIDSLIDSLYREQNIARECISCVSLIDADGVPNYSKFSLRKAVGLRGV
ncbi:MAG: winged helix-turn-helix transcriptional regulator [Candidatus Thorarchaeota archaeon]